MIASAPGKLILTGEYAVLDGAPALVVAVDRRAVARAGRGEPSPFLDAIAAELGRAELGIAVDSRAFYTADGAHKLGLGSSAAVTVAATALALGAAAAAAIDRARVLAVATAAHARAQGARGAPGSGADIAAAVHGGVIEYRMATGAVPRAWPAGLALVPFFTNASADTASFVTRVAAHAGATTAALTAIADASRAACAACASRDPELAATGLFAALVLAAAAMDRLAEVTGLPLVPPCVARAHHALRAVGGLAKTTGAGGGDVAIAVIPNTREHVTNATRCIIQAGGQPLDLAVDHTGVDLHPSAQ